MMSSDKKKTILEVLPNNWILVRSRTHSRRTYYFNKVTKESTWKNPLKKLKEAGIAKDNSQTSHCQKKPRKRKVDGSPTNAPVSGSKKIDKPSTATGSRLKEDKTQIKGDGSKRCEAQKSVPAGVAAPSRQTAKERPPTQPRFAKIKENNRTLLTRKSSSSSATACTGSSEVGDGKRGSRESAAARENALAEAKATTTEDSFEAASKGRAAKSSIKDLVVERVKKDKKFQERLNFLHGANDSSDVNEEILNRNYSDASMNDEEMDWEPSDQEIMIEHIKLIRKNISSQVEPSNHIAICPGGSRYETSPLNKLILVYDTNIFISCLSFVKELRDTFVSDFGLPFVFVPWRVIHELDRLKTSKKRQLRTCAARAIKYINDNFASRHPRVRGQSFEEFSAVVTGCGACVLPDDEILQVCLRVKQMAGCRQLIFITNDRNLETKAVMSGVEAFSKDRFTRELLSRSAEERGFDGVVHGGRAEMSISKSKNDVLYCKLKSILKELFKSVVETELKLAFNEDWEEILRKKPPWTLSDSVECLTLHWHSVFTFVFRKKVLALAEELRRHFARADSGDETLIFESIRISRELLTAMRTTETSGKAYAKLLDGVISEVEGLVRSGEDLTQKVASEEGERTKFPAVSFPACASLPIFDQQMCKEKIKNLLNVIWNQMRDFGSTISEMASRGGVASNPSAASEVCSQYPHAVRNMSELTRIVEEILLAGRDDIHRQSQVIVYFSNFLLSLNLIQNESSDAEHLPLYLAVFCRDTDGRHDLGVFLNGVKQFGAEITNGMKSLGYA